MVLPTSTFTPDPHRPGRKALYNSGYFGIEDIQNLPRSDLTNPIHIIFNENNFSWNTPGLYIGLEPTFRLASRLLERALPVYHTLYYNDPKPICPTSESKEAMYVDPDPANFTDTQEKLAGRLLKKLAKVVQFTPANRADLDGAEGITYNRGRDPTNTVKGDRSEITFSCNDIDEIVRLRTAEQLNKASDTDACSEDRIKLFWLEFTTANTLVHELAHATVNAAGHGDSDSNPYDHIYAGPTTEEGFALEKFLYGGPVYQELRDCDDELRYRTKDFGLSMLEGYIVMHDWPCPNIMRTYKTNWDPIHIRNPLSTDIFCHWRVNFAEIARLFYDEFWNATPQRDLKITRERAWRYTASQPTGLGPGHLFPDKAVPEGFHVTNRGLVLRN